MPEPTIVASPPAWLLALHLLGMAAYAGGLLSVSWLLVRASRVDAALRTPLAREARRLYLLVTTPGGALMLLAGLWMLLGDPGWDAYRKAPWMHIKLTVVVALLVVDHALVLRPVKALALERATDPEATAGLRTGTHLAIWVLVATALLAVRVLRDVMG